MTSYSAARGDYVELRIAKSIDRHMWLTVDYVSTFHNNDMLNNFYTAKNQHAGVVELSQHEMTRRNFFLINFIVSCDIKKNTVQQFGIKF